MNTFLYTDRNIGSEFLYRVHRAVTGHAEKASTLRRARAWHAARVALTLEVVHTTELTNTLLYYTMYALFNII